MTATKKLEMYARIEQHGNNLNAIFNTGIEPVKLCKSLLRLENKANNIAVKYCNGDIDMETAQEQAANILRAVNKLLLINEKHPFNIYFNYDARGYALKIKDYDMIAHGINLYRDWGNNGILAPDFTPNN